MVNPKIGYSLPFNYIIGDTSTDYDAIFPSINDCLKYLKEKGIDSIELRCVIPATPAPRTLETV